MIPCPICRKNTGRKKQTLAARICAECRTIMKMKDDDIINQGAYGARQKITVDDGWKWFDGAWWSDWSNAALFCNLTKLRRKLAAHGIKKESYEIVCFDPKFIDTLPDPVVGKQYVTDPRLTKILETKL